MSIRLILGSLGSVGTSWSNIFEIMKKSGEAFCLEPVDEEVRHTLATWKNCMSRNIVTIFFTNDHDQNSALFSINHEDVQ